MKIEQPNKIKLEIRYHLKHLKNDRLSKRTKLEFLLSAITRRCSGKGHLCNGGWAYLKHSNCAYQDELSNYNFCCSECHDTIDANYQEWWDEYNNSRY